MKRSKQVTLVLLTGVTALALAGCEEAPPAKPDNGGTFASKAECVAVYDQKTCDAAEKLAQAEHAKNAPKYGTREACILEYGPDMCQPASAYSHNSNDSFFVPMMLGYMLGSANSYPAPLYYGPGSYREQQRRGAGYSAPIYSSGRGYSNKTAIGSAPYVKSPAPTTKGSLKGTTSLTPPAVQRGGFGSSFKPTNQFKATYASKNPDSFGRSGYNKSTGTSYSSKSYSSSSRSSSSSVSRGGFGSSGRSFGGGGG